MPYVVTQPCCGDASCVFACPVNCIHPTPDEPDFGTAEMLYIDPAACIECGACVSACPVEAIVPDAKLAPAQRQFLDINADFYKTPRDRPTLAPVTPAAIARADREPLRVAVVGSGPAAMYAADELLLQPGARVNVFDRLPTPYGLVRAGVAPDHQKTKQVTELFDTIAQQPGFGYFLNVEVGADVTHEELLAHHHAVIYAVGASADRRLGIPGEDLPGCASATGFVAWYNGHPDHVGDAVDLSGPRAVIVGNGNVALDVARILTTDPDTLARTDIADHALAALRDSRIEEVVILARRGPAQSACTVPELVGLLQCPDVDVLLDAPDAMLDDLTAEHESAGTLDQAVGHKLGLLRSLQRSDTPPTGRRRIVLRYLAAPTAIVGNDRVEGVDVVDNTVDGSVRVRALGDPRRLDAGLVLTSIGYRGVPVPGLPFDAERGVLPNDAGRVGPGTYAAGWIKRGPTGFIGTNKSCSHETVNTLVEDYNADRLSAPAGSGRDLRQLVRRRHTDVVDRAGWEAIDRHERARGTAQQRPRAKVCDSAELVAAAAAAPSRRRRR